MAPQEDGFGKAVYFFDPNRHLIEIAYYDEAR
jgi:hypothetical protein